MHYATDSFSGLYVNMYMKKIKNDTLCFLNTRYYVINAKYILIEWIQKIKKEKKNYIYTHKYIFKNI